jgi:acetoin utilization protein AcuB
MELYLRRKSVKFTSCTIIKLVNTLNSKMIAQNLISDAIPPLKTSDTGLKALSWMEEFRVSHLPIVNNVDFLGLISEEDILNLNAPEEPIGNHPLSLLRPFVTEDQHVYDILKLIHKLKITIIPVLDKDNQYVGLITLTDLMQKVAEMASIQDPGGVIILELNIHDYALSEIAHIVEQEDGMILSSYITSEPDSTKLELTLKINKTDLSRILSSLYRHNYTVKASFHQSEFTDDLRNRFDSLMNFLNI